MTTPRTAQVPHLLLLRPADGGPPRVDLVDDCLTVGRDPACDVRFSSDHVSRRHAVLVRRDGRTWVRDLGSTAGTRVNGVTVLEEHELHPGDVLDLADVRVRYEAPGSGPDVTAAFVLPPEQTHRSRVPEQPASRFDVGAQTASRDVNNVGRDQITYVQQREAFLREVAATRTRARWLVALGFLLFAAGFAVFASGVLGFLAEVLSAVGQPGRVPEPGTPFGEQVLGLPRALWGWVSAAAGVLCMAVGLVLHVTATARRKRVDEQLPLPGREE